MRNQLLSLTDAAKEARLALKSARKEKEEENINLEGQIYGAGIEGKLKISILEHYLKL